jgi:uncharacterized membrane protein YhdT
VSDVDGGMKEAIWALVMTLVAVAAWALVLVVWEP